MSPRTLGQGIGYEWAGNSLQEIISGPQSPVRFALSLLMVLPALTALYESWSIPVAVMLVEPLGVLFVPVFHVVVRRSLGDKTDTAG